MSDAASSPPRDRYGGAQIRRGLLFFLLGKAITSFAGIGTFVLLVRALPVGEFAAYSIMFGLVDLVAAITGMGVIHVLARYVPEVYALNLNATFRELVGKLFALRFILLTIIIGLMYLYSAPISRAIGLQGWEGALQLYLLAVMVRTILFSLFTLLESMLLQGIAQLGLSLITVARFVLLVAMAWAGILDLMTVIVVEIATDVIGGSLMTVGLLRNMPPAPARAQPDDTGWVRRNLRRMLDYAGKGYVQHMLILPFGGATDRLIVGSSLAATQVALFGFGQWILDLMGRYLPAQLLQGMIRPVLSARYARSGSFAEVVVFTNLMLKVNLAVLAVIFVAVYAGGGEVLGLVSKGKYGDEQAVLLLMLMTVLMALASWRHVLDIATSTVEKNGPLIYAHTVLLLSVIPGVLALPWLGIYALPLSHVIGLVVASLLLIRRLSLAGFDYRMDWPALAKIGALTSVAMLVVWLLRGRLDWLALMGVGMAVILALLAAARPLDTREREAIRAIMRARHEPA